MRFSTPLRLAMALTAAAWLLLVFVALASPAAAQIHSPVSERIYVSSATSDVTLEAPDVAIDAAGNFVVVWTERRSRKVLGRRFAPDGTPVGSDFEIGPVADATADTPFISMNGSGAYVVSWVEYTPPVGWKLMARPFNPDGSPRGDANVVDVADSKVNVPQPQTSPVDIADDGSFVVVWSHLVSRGTRYIYAQWYGPTGDIDGDRITVAEWSSGDSEPVYRNPSVAVSPSGRAVVAAGGQDASRVYMTVWNYGDDRRLEPPTLDLNTDVNSYNDFPHAGVTDDGRAVVAWTFDASSSTPPFLYGRLLSGQTFLGDPYQLSLSQVPLNGSDLDVTSDGNFAVVWGGQSGRRGIYVWYYRTDGSPDAEPVAAYPGGSEAEQEDPSHPAVAMNDAGRIAVVWHVDFRDSDAPGIYARVLAPSIPISVDDEGPGPVPVSIEAMPNPTVGSDVVLFVSLREPASVAIRVTDMLGRVVHSEALSAGPIDTLRRPVRTSMLAPGTYFVRVDGRSLSSGAAVSAVSTFTVAR